MFKYEYTHHLNDTYVYTAYANFGYLAPAEIHDEHADEFLENLYAISHMCNFKEGEVILAHGSTERSLFHIISGGAVVVARSGQILSSLGPGELFGEVIYMHVYITYVCVYELFEEVICVCIYMHFTVCTHADMYMYSYPYSHIHKGTHVSFLETGNRGRGQDYFIYTYKYITHA
jgi:hypothetical protein